jgi:hypothetical protein
MKERMRKRNDKAKFTFLQQQTGWGKETGDRRAKEKGAQRAWPFLFVLTPKGKGRD